MAWNLGPTLPAFPSPSVAKLLVEKFHINGIGAMEEDIAGVMAGRQVSDHFEARTIL
jgi:hydroxylamine reductase